MHKCLTFAILLPLFLAACSSEFKNSVSGDIESGARPERPEKLLERVERLPGSSTNRSIAEIVAKYFPGINYGDLEAADYLRASDRAIENYDYDGAVLLCTEAIKLAPDNPVAYFKRGRAGLDASKANSAETLADLEKAVALNYRNSKAYEFLALAYDSHSQRDKALISISKAIEIAPKDTGLYKLKAAFYAAYGDTKNARKVYDSWILIAPQHPLPYTLRGQLLQTMKEYDAALRDYEKVCLLPEVSNSVSNRDMAFRLRATLLSSLGRHKESIGVLDEALRQDSAQEELFQIRGDEYMFLKDYNRAIADYSKSIKGAPEFAGNALEARGKAYAALGDKLRAGKDFQKARELKEKPAERPI